MSFQDGKLLLCDDFDLSAISASSNSNVTNVLNLGIGEDAIGRAAMTLDPGNNGDVFLNITCNTSFASAGTPSVTFDLHAATAASMASPDTVITFAKDKTVAAGDVVYSGAIPAGTLKQYVTVNVATTAALTAGTISAFLSNYPMQEK